MIKPIIDFFKEEKIEYYSVLDFSDVQTINPRLLGRISFTPKSVIVFLIPYFVNIPKNLSVYAASLDYHIIIRELTDKLIDRLCTHFPEASFIGYGDHSPIDERRAAASAGLGILGDSQMLINEKYGTYTFIADVLTDVDPILLGAKAAGEVAECEHCGACKAVCPTGILRGECPDCLSAITQRKGELTPDECELMREANTAWGCDLCQRVCPHNASAELTPLDFFRRDRIECLTSELLEGMSDTEFERRAFAWRKRATVERNLKILDC